MSRLKKCPAVCRQHQPQLVPGRRAPAPARPPVELLEQRRLLSASAVLFSSSGFLRVEGTGKADTIVLRTVQFATELQSENAREPESTQREALQLEVKINNQAFYFDPSSVRRIKVFAFKGHDVIASQTEDKREIRRERQLEDDSYVRRVAFTGPVTQPMDVFASTGDDTIIGGNGRDNLGGEGGNDIILGGNNNDSLFGGTGFDELIGGNGDDSIVGGAGNDSIFGSRGNDTLLGGDNNDTIRGEAGDDVISGNSGADKLYGDTGNDTIDGGGGRDDIFGDVGDDELFGGNGDDLIKGEDGNDTLRGGRGVDTLFSGLGNNDANGGEDRDFVDGLIED